MCLPNLTRQHSEFEISQGYPCSEAVRAALQWGAVVWQACKGVSVTSLLFSLVELTEFHTVRTTLHSVWTLPTVLWLGCLHNSSPQGGTSGPWTVVELLCRKEGALEVTWGLWPWRFSSGSLGPPQTQGLRQSESCLPRARVSGKSPTKGQEANRTVPASVRLSPPASPPWAWKNAFLPEDKYVQRTALSQEGSIWDPGPVTMHQLGTSGELWRIHSIVLLGDLCRRPEITLWGSTSQNSTGDAKS